jgi:hypothetical protein
VCKHGERLELRDGLGDGRVLCLRRLGIVSPQIAVVWPPHPAPRVLLKLPCSSTPPLISRTTTTHPSSSVILSEGHSCKLCNQNSPPREFSFTWHGVAQLLRRRLGRHRNDTAQDQNKCIDSSPTLKISFKPSSIFACDPS